MLQLTRMIGAIAFWLLAGLAILMADQDADKIDRLIKQLGSAKFSEREAASQQLEEIGAAALPALRKALTSRDAETRRRATNLIPLICSRMCAKAKATVEGLGGHVVEGFPPSPIVDLSRTNIRPFRK
jgi:HEAT repeat protein